jgi:hypothetical protein
MNVWNLSVMIMSCFGMLSKAAQAVLSTASGDLRKPGTSSSSSAVEDAPPDSSCNRASTLEECQAAVDDETSEACEWCVAGAIPSECMSSEQATLLPSGVFQCSTPQAANGDAVIHKEVVFEYSDEDANQVDNTNNNKVMMEKKKIVTVTVRAGEVATTQGDSNNSQDFCDGSSKSISGYMDLKGSDYDKAGEDKHLFFWMFERRPQPEHVHGEDNNDDKSAIPFVVWLTGGPGCSSTLALLTENGPCSVNPDGTTTTVNEYSWTEAAHVLWLDQVGRRQAEAQRCSYSSLTHLQKHHSLLSPPAWASATEHPTIPTNKWLQRTPTGSSRHSSRRIPSTPPTPCTLSASRMPVRAA